jgi:hypothetical protein
VLVFQEQKARGRRMHHLCDLPDEILSPILASLYRPPRFSRIYKHPDLLNLCLVSKKLLSLAQGLLYSVFLCYKAKETWTIRAFLRTIIRQPRLALHVRKLVLISWRAYNRQSDEWDDTDYDSERKYSTAQNLSDRKLFQRAIKELALPDKQFWRSAVRKDIDEVYVALLILLLPNLRTLQMLAPSEPEVLAKALYYATILQNSTSSVRSLQRLEHVHYGVRGNTTSGDVTFLAPFFRIPSVSVVHNGGLSASGLKVWPRQPESSYVKQLTLQYAAIEPDILQEILRSTEHLEIFSYKHWDQFRSNPSRFDPPSFTEALRVVAHSLKDLEINYDKITRCPHRQTLGSLEGFTQLQNLSIPLKLLIGPPTPGSVDLVNMLPQSIETLSFTDIDDEFFICHCTRIVAQLTQLMEGRAAYTPLLKRVSARLWQKGRSLQDKNAFAGLIDAAEAAGVELGYTFGQGAPERWTLLRREDWI